MGGNSGSHPSGQAPAGLVGPRFDPGRVEAHKLLADLHDAIALTAEHRPYVGILDFTEHAAEFARVSKFLVEHQHDAPENA